MSTLHPEIVRRLPRTPAWRWSVWHYLKGEECVEITAECRVLGRWSQVNWSDPDERMSELELDTLEAWRARGHSGVERAVMIFTTPDVRLVTERCLLAGLDSSMCAAAAQGSLGLTVTSQHIDCYREVFFDTVNIAVPHIADWNTARGVPWEGVRDVSMPPSLKREWAKAMAGLDTTLNANDALQAMLVRSVTTSMMVGALNPELAIAWQDQGIKLLRAGKELGLFSNGKGRLPDHLVADIDSDWAALDGAAPEVGDIDRDDSYKKV